MNGFFSNVQQFFHSVTTNDRYASGSRTSQNGFGRRTTSGGFGPSAPLTSSDDYDSASDPSQNNHHPNNPYSNPSSANGSSTNLASSSQTSLNRLPYTPGMRSSQIGNGGNIPLQDYADGIPPPPSLSISWTRIDRWMEANYPELGEEVSDEATSPDLNELEADLECSLPLDVRDSFLIHDGQERGSRPCGLIFGLTLLDLESVSEEWTHWKNTANKIRNMAKAYHANQRAAATAGKAPAPGPSTAPPQNPPRPRGPRPAGKMTGNLNWLDHQDSVPEGAIQRVYAHPAWIPLISDYLGNNIGVDLAPGPKGRWGQVILFGREFDRKYVVAPSWAHFMMTFADDLENGNHLIVDETEFGEFSFRASNGRVVPYFDVLRSRADRLERQRKPPGPSPHQGGPGRRTGSQTNLSGAPRISPRNSSSNTPAAVPGRNVSGNFRRPNQVPTLPKEGRLISPMNSSTHLPSTGLTKSPTPPLISTPKQTPAAAPKGITEILLDAKPETKDAKAESSDKPESKVESKSTEDKETESKAPVESKPESKEAKVETKAKDDKPEAASTSDKAADKESDFKISDENDSDDEVDLLKEELTEVAI